MNDLNKCAKCANCIRMIGAFTHTVFLSCSLEEKRIAELTDEELREEVFHPEKRKTVCEFQKGKPQDGGVTYDD